MNRLYYGIKKGKIVSINDVCSGKECDCICPSCGEQLIAKKGKIKIHHFAHSTLKECEYGYETTLHLLAKDIIENANHFVLPEEKLSKEYYKQEQAKTKNKSIRNAVEIIIDKVEVELNFDNIKPDIILYSGVKKYFVEIFVTHKIDNSKREKIKSKCVDTIEIDLSNIEKDTEYNTLEKILLNDDKRKYWIYNNNIELMIDKLEKTCVIPLVMHGCALHTEYCPNKVRVFRGKSYANVYDDCSGCENFLNMKEQNESDWNSGVICIAACNSSQVDNEEKKEELFCPKCNAKLVIRRGRFGKFYGCSNFPKCRYTRNI